LPPLSEADLIEQLSAIGYLAGIERARDSQGVTQHDPQRGLRSNRESPAKQGDSMRRRGTNTQPGGPFRMER
jgi:hypothetical protein